MLSVTWLNHLSNHRFRIVTSFSSLLVGLGENYFFFMSKSFCTVELSSTYIFEIVFSLLVRGSAPLVLHLCSIILMFFKLVFYVLSL